MKRYKISQFSKRCGVSADTLRYYEKANLLHPQHDPENGYRFYTDYDLVTLLHLRTLRGMDIPVSELGDSQGHRLDRLYASVTKQVSNLEQEIELLEHKLRRFRKLKTELEECMNAVGAVSNAVFPEMYCFYLDEENLPGDKQQLIGELANHSSYAHMTFKIPGDQLSNPDINNYSAVPGIGILKSYADSCKLQHVDKLATVKEGNGVRALLRIADPLQPSRDELAPIFEYLNNTDQIAMGDWFYRLRLIERLPNGKNSCYVAVRVYTKRD